MQPGKGQVPGLVVAHFRKGKVMRTLVVYPHGAPKELAPAASKRLAIVPASRGAGTSVGVAVANHAAQLWQHSSVRELDWAACGVQLPPAFIPPPLALPPPVRLPQQLDSRVDAVMHSPRTRPQLGDTACQDIKRQRQQGPQHLRLQSPQSSVCCSLSDDDLDAYGGGFTEEQGEELDHQREWELAPHAHETARRITRSNQQGCGQPW